MKALSNEEINTIKTEELSKKENMINFNKWLIENGALYSHVQYPIIFGDSLLGISAKSDIPAYSVFAMIPSNIIISQQQIEFDSEVGQLFIDNKPNFNENEDGEFLRIIAFIIYQKLKGKKSFWNPYLEGIGETELLCFWDENELNNLNDSVLKAEANYHKYCLEENYGFIKTFFSKFPSKINDFKVDLITKDLYNWAYKTVYTRCYGWGLPSTMLIPLADCINHNIVNTSYNFIQKQDIENISNPAYKRKVKSINKLNFLDLNIKSNSPMKTTTKFIESSDNKEKMIWEDSYLSESDQEDNDEENNTKDKSEDEIERDYAEYLRSLNSEIEQKMLEKVTLIEKKQILAANNAKYRTENEDFSWWKWNDKNTYFISYTERKAEFKKGSQIYTSYGKRSNYFLLLNYGFSLENNKYDSYKLRMWTNLTGKQKVDMNPNDFLLNDQESIFAEEFEEQPEDDETDYSEFTKILLKKNKLPFTLLSLLRAMLLINYEGPNIAKINISFPTDLSFETLVIKFAIILLVHEKGKYKVEISNEKDLLKNESNQRKKFAIIYRISQQSILESNIKLLNILLTILHRMKNENFKKAYEGVAEPFEIMNELKSNRLLMRKYLNQLWIHCQEIIKTT